ncbi:minor capsid protein [Streptomyces sp. NPDC000941]
MAAVSYTPDLLDGLAQLIADQGIAVYRPDGVYTVSETGLTVAVMPDNPDRIVALTAYPVEDTHLTDAITGVQVRVRASRDPREADQLADALFDLLHGREHFVAGGIHIGLCWRQSQGPLGQDQLGRMELAANYYLRTTRAATHAYE